MLTLTVVLMCITVRINCATLPNSEILLPPSQELQRSADQDVLNSVHPSIESDATKKPNICTTETCNKESGIILNSLDETVNPCDDFYEFACGNFMRKTVLPEDKAVDVSFLQLEEKVGKMLHLILTEESKPDESHSFKLAKEFTKMCMDEALLKEEGIKPIMNILENYGGWPVVKGDAWDDEHWNWIETKQKILNDGLVDDIIFEFAVRSDFRNSSKRIIYIDRPEFGLSEKFLMEGVEHPKVEAYFDFMVDAAVLFGANRSNAKIELHEALEFEMELAKIALPVEDRRNLSILINEFSVSELQKTFPYVNWLEFINSSLYNSISFNESENVIVPDKNYMLQLETLLQSTPKRQLANYIAWRLVLYTSDLLNDVLHQRNQKFIAATTGMQESNPRLTECVKRTMEFPSYMNFGAIGWFIGHEITHGFDDNGRQFDLNGNLANWWEKETEAKFASKAKCFIDQYSKYIHPTLNLTVNHVNSQGENIADNGGIKAAYTAYQTFIHQNGPDQMLTGLNYTANQLFWISAAQLWCAVTRPEFESLQYTTNVHAPFNYRIIGAFTNSQNFSSGFKCSKNDRMNPVEKCEIW